MRILLLVWLFTCPIFLAAQVVINEIMYHPQEVDLPFPNYDDKDDAEFIELKNIGAVAIDVSDWCFIGVDFCFPAGTSIAPNSIVTLSKKASVFQSEYGFAADFDYGGKLSNSGEQLAIVDAAGNLIQNLTFTDIHPWPVLADGLGYSMELACSNCDSSKPYNWKISNHANGHTVGATNSNTASSDLPNILLVNRSVLMANPSQAVQITATIENATSVQIQYSLNFGALQNATLISNANGVYIYEIPGFLDGDLIQYKILASNASGNSTYPRADNIATTDGYVVKNNNIAPSNFPIVNWHYNGIPDSVESVIEHQGKVVSNSDVWWRRNKHWKVEMPKGTTFEIPGYSNFSVDELQFNRPDHLFGWWVNGTMARTAVYTNIIGEEGEPALDAFNVRVDENGQYGKIWTYLSWPDGNWREQVGIEEKGSEYWKFPSNIVNGIANPEIKYPKGGDSLNLYNLIVVKDLPGSHLMDVYDIPGMVNFAALSTLICHWDAGTKNFYMHKSPNGRWDGDIWDVDAAPRTGIEASDSNWCKCSQLPEQDTLTLSNGVVWQPAESNKGNMFAKPLLANEPRVYEMYQRRLRTLIDKYYAPGELIGRVQQFADTLDVDIDYTANSYSPTHNIAENQQNIYVDLPAWQMQRYNSKPDFPPSSTGASNVVINEIQYSPIGGRQEEFVELYNNSNESIDLSNWFIYGLSLQLPAGTVILENDYLVVAKDSPSFIAKYGSGKYVAADFINGQLQNGGETIQLAKPDGTIIDAVTYEQVGWKQANGGPSLERINSVAPSNDANNWAPSSTAFGTPDAPNQPNPAANYPPNPSPVNGLVINEIMYNAPNYAGIPGDDVEFIELKNVSSSTLNLNGVYFSDGIEYNFSAGDILAPGQFIVLAADELLFRLKYGFLPFGEYDGKLSASGETVELSDAFDYVIDQVTYDDVAPWTTLPDGTGYSLALIDGTINNDVSTNWYYQAVDDTPNQENDFCFALTLNSAAINVDCFGNTTGSLVLVNPGTHMPYTYSWSNGSTMQNPTNLGAGNYTVTATDRFGCTFTHSATINTPTALNVSSVWVDETVAGANDGVVNLAVAGGTPPYSYNWSNGATWQDINNLSPGNYSVTVTDANSCTQTYSVTIAPGTVACALPSNIAASNIQGTSATLSWAADANVNNYSVEYRAVGAATWQVFSSNYSFAILNNLNSCTTYEVRILANCPSAQTSGYSNIYTFETIGCVPTCQNIIGLFSQNVTNSSAFLVWDIVPNATYTMYYRVVGNATWFSYPSQFPIAILFTLPACTDFEWYVEVNCPTGQVSTPSPIANFTTIGVNCKTNENQVLNDNLNQALGKVMVYPNPVKQTLHYSFESESTSNYKIEIIDVLGKTHLTTKEDVKKGVFNGSLNVRDLSNGIYWLRFVSGQDVWIEKFEKL